MPLWEMRLWWRPGLILFSPDAASRWFSLPTSSVVFQGCWGSGEQEKGVGTLEHHRSRSSCWNSVISPVWTLLDCCKPRFFRRVDSDDSCQFSLCFLWRKFFDSLLSHFYWCHLCNHFFLVLHATCMYKHFLCSTEILQFGDNLQVSDKLMRWNVALGTRLSAECNPSLLSRNV